MQESLPGIDRLLLNVLPITFAYIGPGAGITVIGAAIALVVGIVVTIVGLVWYPIKRLLRVFTRSKPQTTDASLSKENQAEGQEKKQT